MKKIPLLLATASFGIISGCATYAPPVDRGLDKTMIVNANFDKTWQIATEWFANGNIPIKNIVKDSGLIATDYRLGTNASYLDCGTLGAMQAFNDKTINLNVLVKEISSNETSVRANVFGTGRVSQTDLYGNSTGGLRAVDCISTGKLESDLFETLKSP